MKHLNQYITEYIIKKKLDKPIDSEYKYHPQTKDELIENIKELLDKGETDLNCIDTIDITDMSNLFKDLDVIKDNNFDVSDWNVSNVKNMSQLFYDCINFNCDLSKWNISNVTNIQNMFEGCESFEGKGLEKWDVYNIENMNNMFKYCRSFDGKSIENWDVSNVVSARNMFYKCENLNCDLSNWDVSKVKDKGMMFYGCIALKNKPSWYKE